MSNYIPTTNLRSLRRYIQEHDGMHAEPQITAAQIEAERADALERAGELACGGYLSESRKQALRWRALGDEVQG